MSDPSTFLAAVATESRLAFFDSAPLGPDPRIHPTWEWAVIVDSTEYIWQTRVTAEQLAVADQDLLATNGFHDRYDPTTALEPDEALQRFVDLIGVGRILVGALVGYDVERVRELWRTTLGQPPDNAYPWNYHLLDIEGPIVGWLAAHGKPLPLPWTADDLTSLIGIDIPEDERHTPISVARWTRQVWAHITAP